MTGWDPYGNITVKNRGHAQTIDTGQSKLNLIYSVEKFEVHMQKVKQGSGDRPKRYYTQSE